MRAPMMDASSPPPPADAGVIHPDADTTPTYCTPQPWETELILDDSETRPDKVSMAVADDGTIYVSFDKGNQAWFAERKVGAQWTTTSVDAAINRSTTTSALAVDTQGRPHIVYGQNTRNQRLEVEHHWREAGQWTSETIHVGGGSTTISPHYLIDERDTHHITFYTGAGSSLRYASKTSTGPWQLIDTGWKATFRSAPMAMDREGSVHISFEHHQDSALGHAKLTGGVWSDSLVDDTVDLLNSSDVFIDTDNRPTIAYPHRADKAVKIAHQTDTGWEIEKVADGEAISVTAELDQEETTHLFYVQPLDSQIVHAARRRGETTWTTEEVATTTRHATLSTTTTGEGTLHVVYLLVQERELHYAVRRCL